MSDIEVRGWPEYPANPPVMVCGHTANSLQTIDGEYHAACVIHGTHEIAEDQPDLAGRMAKCVYFGQVPRHNESNYGCRGKDTCDCEVPTTASLPFLELKPDKAYDEFYCGCKSWN